MCPPPPFCSFQVLQGPDEVPTSVRASASLSLQIQMLISPEAPSQTHPAIVTSYRAALSHVRVPRQLTVMGPLRSLGCVWCSRRWFWLCGRRGGVGCGPEHGVLTAPVAQRLFPGWEGSGGEPRCKGGIFVAKAGRTESRESVTVLYLHF